MCHLLNSLIRFSRLTFIFLSSHSPSLSFPSFCPFSFLFCSLPLLFIYLFIVFIRSDFLLHPHLVFHSLVCCEQKRESSCPQSSGSKSSNSSTSKVLRFSLLPSLFKWIRYDNHFEFVKSWFRMNFDTHPLPLPFSVRNTFTLEWSPVAVYTHHLRLSEPMQGDESFCCYYALLSFFIFLILYPS